MFWTKIAKRHTHAKSYYLFSQVPATFLGTKTFAFSLEELLHFLEFYCIATKMEQVN